MINRPLNEILHATKKMAKGNFDINLIPHHEYKNYDEFDLIKLDLNRLAEELSKKYGVDSRNRKIKPRRVKSYIEKRGVDSETANAIIKQLDILLKEARQRYDNEAF